MPKYIVTTTAILAIGDTRMNEIVTVEYPGTFEEACNRLNLGGALRVERVVIERERDTLGPYEYRNVDNGKRTPICFFLANVVSIEPEIT